MELTYKKFIETVPKETAKFVKFLLPCLDYFGDNKDLKFGKNMGLAAHTEYDKIVYLIFYALCENEKYASFLGQFGFQQSTVMAWSRVPSEKELSKIFNERSYVFAIFDDEIEYQRLSPLDVLSYNIKKYCNESSISSIDSLFKLVFTKSTGIRDFEQNLRFYKETEKNLYDQMLEQETYNNLSVSVVSYLEVASKIRKILLEEKDYLNNQFIKNIDTDIVPLSLFLALYYYKDALISKEVNTSEQRLTKIFLEDNNFNLSKIYQKLSINVNDTYITNTEPSLVAIKDLFIPYIEKGVCENIKRCDITVSKIIENVINRDFTKSYALEKIFNSLDLDTSIFNSFDEKISKMLKEEKKKIKLNYVKDFYSKLDKDTKDFIDFTCKTYILLLEKMKLNTHNNELLSREDDADSLALLIASYYFGGNVSDFFLDNNVTLEEILKLLKIEITKEEIEKVQLNKKLLVDRYKRFVYEGINTSKKNIQKNDIINNLCNREFNRSIIIESLFEEINQDINLSNNFYNQLQKHIETKERKRINAISQKFFHDMPVDTINYLENVVKIHNSIISKTDKLNKNDIKVYSLLLGILNSDSDVKEFFESQGFDVEKISNYINVDNVLYNLKSNPQDIDLLVSEYSKYILGGHNKDKQRKDLTVLNISKNIFNKQLSDSVSISRFLATFNLDYEKFEDFDKLYKEFLVLKKEESTQKEGKEFVDKLDYSTKLYINNVLKIHKGIVKQLLDNNGNKDLLSNDDSIAVISMLLALYIESNNKVKFFEKNNITLDKILSICNLKNVNVRKFLNDDIDYSLVFNVYKKYFDGLSFDDIIKKMFEEENQILVKYVCTHANANYERLKKEIETGKDYEETLTMDDRIKLLEQEDVSQLDFSELSSILYFGDTLINHSKYIHDELPKLELSDVHDSSVSTINNIINKMYQKEKTVPKKNNFFTKFFAVEKTEEEAKLVLNTDAISELRPAIEDNIEALSQELLAYDAIRKYMEVYEKKNRSYYLVATKTSHEIEDSLSKLNLNNPDEYCEFLSTNSKLQAINAKVERFATTSQLLRQEIFKVNQAIVNHFITINALEMAKTDLMPLIGSELAIAKGRSTENQAMELSHNVIQLFQAIISRNVDSTIDNIEQLKKSNIPTEIFEILNKDVERYLEDLNNYRSITDELKIQDNTVEENSSIIDSEKKLSKTI